jgi:hypothetical protein
VERARQALADALAVYNLPSVEAVAMAERRRSDLLAEQSRVVEQARSEGEDEKLRQRLATLNKELQEDPGTSAEGGTDGTASAPPLSDLTTAEELESRITQQESDLHQTRDRRDQAQAAQQLLQKQLQEATEALDRQRQTIEAAEQALRLQENQLLEARIRCQGLLQRHGSPETLQAAITTGEQRRDALQTALTALREELKALDPEHLKAEDQRLTRRIEELERQELEAREARIRAEERLYSDGSTDLQAEREQKLAEVESRLQDQERLEKEAAMLSLLRRLLEEEQNAMGSQYTAPILSRIGRYLGEVFPQAPEASLTYDARGGFQGLQWRMGHDSAFRFEVLSTGAREQFAAALRVAMAEVLAEAYDGSLPLLFDDAFANSDPERQAGVYRMLQQAADQGLQVLLLTCDPQRSQGIAQAGRISLGD